MDTCREPIGRFVVEYNERLPERHQAELRARGIDPDDNWLLLWSFEDEEDAHRCMEEEQYVISGYIRTYRVRDRGEDAPRYIERPVW